MIIVSMRTEEGIDERRVATKVNLKSYDTTSVFVMQ